MDEEYNIHYTPHCQVRGCPHDAVYKIAAQWSDGNQNELKNYGTFCEIHGMEQLRSARRRRDALRLAEGESLGPVRLYRLIEGFRDAELQPVGD